ncbi:ejaculatory bulb-specific protein 3-like [Aricia agestis]|uniref:ejaculatory bulb-specific protein 3-like n=1 Tax=Aricia agestis TaxID=91739 RepID=UPI001C20A536|nr:ejaculatory bulb-specific protein 3-like [Aricia agestis]
MDIRNMRCVLLLCFISLSAAYEDVDDNFMTKFVLAKDKASLGQYFSCLVDKGPCDEFAQSVKSHMSEVVTSGCNKCDYAQKHVSHFFITTLRRDFPDLYEAFENKYDPDRTLLPQLDENLKEFW